MLTHREFEELLRQRSIDKAVIFMGHRNDATRLDSFRTWVQRAFGLNGIHPRGDGRFFYRFCRSNSSEGRKHVQVENQDSGNAHFSASFAERCVGLVIFGDVGDAATVEREMELWLPKLTSGGIICGCNMAGVRGPALTSQRVAEKVAESRRMQICVTASNPGMWYLANPCSRVAASADIALVSGFERSMASVGAISSENKARYCHMNGYTCAIEVDGFDPSRPPAWSKILFVEKHLRSHQWVFWSDADSLVMNSELRLEQQLDEQFDMVISREDFGVGTNGINSGNFFLKSTDWSFRLLKEIYAQTDFVNDRGWENAAIIRILKTPFARGHVTVANQRRFNAYTANYAPGDFVIHFPNTQPHERLRLMNEYHLQAG